MHKRRMDHRWFKQRKTELDLTDQQIADAAGRERSVINKVINGAGSFAFDRADELARLFEVSRSEILMRIGVLRPGDLVSDQPLTRSADAGETVEIIQLDLSLPMGSGATIDDYIEEEPRVFDLAYIRGFTRTPAHRLRIARGVGDSMFPTLQSSDLVWIDGTRTELNVSDKIWAVSINGAAAIKRLRPVAGGRVLVLSDNKTIGDYEVDRSELLIGGRVIRFARDL